MGKRHTPGGAPGWDLVLRLRLGWVVDTDDNWRDYVELQVSTREQHDKAQVKLEHFNPPFELGYKAPLLGALSHLMYGETASAIPAFSTTSDLSPATHDRDRDTYTPSNYFV